MKKFWRGFRKASDLREREELRKEKENQLAKLRECLALGYDGEAKYVNALKAWNKNMSREELQERIRQFRDAVAENQERNRELY